MQHLLRRRVLLVAALSVLVVAAALSWLTYDLASRGLDARREFLAAREELTAARATLKPVIEFDASSWPSADAYAEARSHIASAEQLLAGGRERLGYAERVGGWLGWLPRWGSQIAQASAVLDLGESVAGTVNQLLELAEPLFVGDEPIVDSAREVFVVRQERVLAALDRLSEARASARELQSEQWSGPFAEVDAMLRQFDSDLERVDEARDLVRALGDGFDALLGFGEPAAYVVLGQNSEEMRPTGGFVGTIGRITLDGGEVTESDYRRAYQYVPLQLTGRVPPEPIVTFFGSSDWWVVEANWWPHFPDSAREVLKMLADDKGISADFVVAFDTRMVTLMIEAVGPLELPEFPQPLTAENWLVQFEQQLFVPSSGEALQKSELGVVLEEVISRAQNADRAQVPGLLKALEAGVAGRHLQLFSVDAATQRLIERLGASGSMVAPQRGDFVAVVDANFSANKIQSVIRREIDYVAHSDGSTALAVTWHNDLSQYEGERYVRLGIHGGIWNMDQSTIREAPGVFGNFARIYLPLGSVLVSVDGFDSAVRYELENGFAVVSGFVEVRDGESRTVRLEYRPTEALQPDPMVVFWKQGGQVADTLRVVRGEGGAAATLYEGPLDRDLSFSFR